jgi:uncharacterized protein (DUF433 family)
MNENNGYQHLERRPGSNYKQLFVKGRKIRALILYSQTIGEDARTPEEVAEDYDLPLEVVREAIDYCIRNPGVLREDYDRETANLKKYWEKHPPVVPPGYVPES